MEVIYSCKYIGFAQMRVVKKPEFKVNNLYSGNLRRLIVCAGFSGRPRSGFYVCNRLDIYSIREKVYGFTI
ncbi:hypothetical protein D1627_15575 [Pontibacter oryzae]|uniref:Uncharacterized protein n=1 Tax=Pontibacter oryzae TaxID=2304593 RepID=A0A399RWA3_9BACT|nr:hypothetical protein D1627_15575 [Pontibacter oryzae]